MIKLGANLKFDVQPIEYPMTIVGENICLHCGASGSLQTVNIIGKPDPSGIRPFSHIKCNNCGRIFSIKWTQTENDKMIPVPVDPSIKNEILNMFSDKTNKENTLG
jgi:hypothetical protein